MQTRKSVLESRFMSEMMPYREAMELRLAIAAVFVMFGSAVNWYCGYLGALPSNLDICVNWCGGYLGALPS